jgi:hypothetical protein
VNNGGVERAALWAAAAAGLVLLATAGMVGLPWATIDAHLGRVAPLLQVAILGAGLVTVAVVGAAWRQVRAGRMRWG